MSAEAIYFDCMEQEDLGTEVERRDAWNRIENAYIAPGRYYHNLQHINHVITRMSELPRDDKQSVALQLAAIYHDVIYIPGSGLNEMASASYAALDLGEKGLNSGLTSKVMWLIKTTTHGAFNPDADPSEKVLCDADLYELSTDRYQENAKNLRKEFSKASDYEWTKGRYDWLVGFLARPRIFHLDGRGYDPRDRKELDRDARANMVNEMKELDVDLLVYEPAPIT